VATDSYGAILDENILPTDTDEDLLQLLESRVELEDSSSLYEGSSIWDEDDVINLQLPPLSNEESQQTVSTLSDVGTCSSPIPGPRRSTKMRVATLAYLWKFADHPRQLRDEFRRLRTDHDLQVLHLCGCGLCKEENGTRVSGCVERTHLILGTAVMNGHHRTFHETLALCQVSDYTDLCRIFHNTQAGLGVF
jgi:hypothetical protein